MFKSLILISIFILFNDVASKIARNIFVNPEQKAFQRWVQQFSVNYSSSNNEQEAFENFCINRKLVEDHNARYFACKESYALGLWRKSDLNALEVNDILNGLDLSAVGIGSKSYVGPYKVVPANVSYLNYDEMGYCTPVQDQGNCGSCWAFSSTGSLEGQIFKRRGKLVKLSEQQLIDCSRRYGNYGCISGVMNYAYNYIRQFGIATDEAYPYKGVDNVTCTYNSTLRNATISGFTWTIFPDEEFLKDMLFSVGPLAAAVDASLFTFQNYKTGIYNDTDCSTRLNHAILIVGFGTDDVWGDYWIIKNSYGLTWGENGYMRIARGVNRCGIQNFIVFPDL